MPLRRTSGQHTFSSPANSRIRSFDIQHTDNPSLHDGSTSYQNSRPAETLGEQKVVTAIVARLVNKLPCNSGNKLAMMEIDEGVKQTVESLRSISRIRLSLVVQALATALETLSKYSNNAPLIEAPLDTIHSQLYLLHVLMLCLSESWRVSSASVAPLASDFPQCWPDPAPLDDHLARHLLGVLVIYIRMVSQEVPGVGSGHATPIPSRDAKSASSTNVATWGRPTRSSTSSVSLGAKFIQRHSYSSLSSPVTSTAELSKLQAPTASSTGTAINQMAKHTARIVFFLSASNWPLVLSRVKARVAHLSTTLEENPELYELRLLEWANVDASRLSQALSEVAGPFLHVKRPAQTALAGALRNAIWNWIDVYPAEYHGLIEGTRKLDGNPDLLFDNLMSMSDSTNKRAKVFYPLMAMLLVLSPDTMKRIALNESGRGSSGFSKKLSFMESLRKGLNQSKSFEACCVCYVDLVRAAMCCSRTLDSSGIRSLVLDFQNDLKAALFYSPLTSEITDPSVLVNGLVALYRSNPSATSSILFPKLWNDPNDSNKIVGVRACTAIVTEGQRLPWHPPARGLRAEVAPAVRSILKQQSGSVISGQSSRRGRSSIDLPSSANDLTWEILNLMARDPDFAFESIGGEHNDTLAHLFVVISSLTAATCPMTIRAQAAKTNLILLDSVVDSALHDASRAALTANSAPSIWQILIDSSRQLLIDFQLGDVDDMALMAGAFRETVHAVLRATQKLPEIMTKAPNARPAVLIAKVATVTSLTGPDVEQTNLASPALLALSKLMLLVRQAISSNDTEMDEITGHSNMLYELGTLPPATGRQQQQRGIRRVMKAHVRPSTLLSTVWLGIASRVDTLTKKIEAADADDASGDRDFRRRNLTADIDGLTEDESKEWQNLISFLCATSSVCLNEMSLPQTIVEVVGKGVLPRQYEELTDSHSAVEKFLRKCVDFLISSSIHVRESIKDALGNELPLSLCRLLVVQMTKLLAHSVSPAGVSPSEAFTTFVEQAIAVLRLWVDRVTPTKNENVQVDMGELLYLIAQYTHRLGREDVYARIKIKFCQLIEIVLNRPEFVVLGNASKLRNALLEWMTEWSIESFRDEFHSAYDKVQRDLDLACLRAMIPVTDGLVIKSTSDESEDTQNVVKSRLFYRYYTMLVKVLERHSTLESESSQVAASVSGMSTRPGGSDNYPTLAILVLSNLLSANIDVGLKHCLPLGYHEDSTIRTAFIQLLTNILQQGTRFGGLAIKSGASVPKAYFDALTAPNLGLAVAICEACPPSEVDEISSLMFRAFEAKGNLLGLMKVLIEREVSITQHESELFRANSITTRMVNTFGKTYGYNYLRATLEPFIKSLGEKPPECSFELDPSKAAPGEDIERNAEHLRLMCQALLDVIYSSTSRAPALFRALCHHIGETVEQKFPDSRHSAVGSFVFLRFFCPAIVAPESVELDVNPDTRDSRRALLLITKVIQNLANNVLFGNKEAHMKVLNNFLSDNIRRVTQFLSDIAARPKSAEVGAATKAFQEETERTLDLDGDNAVLHRFAYKHLARLEGQLDKLPPSYRPRPSQSSRASRLDMDGAATLINLRRAMESTGPPTEPMRLSPSARSQVYDDFMRHNAGRSVESVMAAFYEGPANHHGRRMFYFSAKHVAYVDYDLLAYHIFSVLDKVAELFDIIIDLTDFSPACELPATWLRRTIQMCPPGIFPLVHTMAVLNPNSYARRRLRRIVADLSAVSPPVGKQIFGASSPGEIAEVIPYVELLLPPATAALSDEAEHVFTHLLCLRDHDNQVPVVIKLGGDCIQVASWRKQELTPGLRAYVVDLIRLKDIDDVVIFNAGPGEHLVIKYSQNQSITFISRSRNEMTHILRVARGRLRETPSQDRALTPSDVPGTLLNVAFLNLSSSDETLRMGAYSLINELCLYFNYDISSLMKVSTGLIIPSNALTFVFKLSKALAAVAPNLTLEFLKEWTIGFTKADLPQKTACLHYISPWLHNLEQFARPSRDDGIETVKQVSEIIRSLFLLTVAESRRLHLALQEHVWSALAGSHEALTDLILAELLQPAINAGLGSEKAECAANILVSLSSTSMKGKLVARLRKTIGHTYHKPTSSLTECQSWNEICILTRLNLALAFNPQHQVDTQLFLPELLHSIVMLIGVGPVLMRQTVYGLVINIIQSLAASASGDMDTSSLQHLLQRAQQPEIIAAFGLTQSAGSLELSGLPQWDARGIAYLDSVETVTRFLGEVLTAGAVATDCANAWRARWMGLVATSTFQHNPATQPQAFTVLGYLAADEVDDDLVYQVLMALCTGLNQFQETDVVLCVSILRCLARIVPGLSPHSPYPMVIFWLAVGVLQLAYIPLFAPALELLITIVRYMDQVGFFINGTTLFDILPAKRKALGDPARKLDQICGINFDVDACFSLVAIIYKGVRHPNTRKLTISALTELLRLSSVSRPDGPDEDGPLIGAKSVAFLTSLLPIAAANGTADLKSLFASAHVEVAEESLRDLSTLSVFELLSIPDNSTALLLVTLIVTILGSASTDSEKLVLYRLLADASQEMPEVVALAYDSLIPRMTAVLSTTVSTSILATVTSIFERAMSDTSYSFPVSGTSNTLTVDANSAHKKNYSGSVSSGNSPGAGIAREQVLEDLGMKGLADMSFQGVKPERLSSMAKWVASLIELLTND